MIIEVNLMNIAMSDEDTILFLGIFDSLGFNINSAKTNILVPANETLALHKFMLQIPENATNGIANIYVNAYKTTSDSWGVPYCPQLSGSFLIMHRNVAILQVAPSSLLIYKDENVSIEVKVRNDGDIAESFNVTIYRNETEIATVSVTNLPPSSESVLTAIWNTGHTEEGRYVIKANASSVPEGDDLSDNTITDGTVEVIQRRHDIEVANVAPLSYAVYIGQVLDVNVTIRNKGTQTESTTIYLYYDSEVAGIWNISGIQAEDQQSRILRWDTTNVPEGNYTISAFAVPIEGEENIADNTLVDGRVRIIASSVFGYFAFTWFDWILLLLFLLMLVLLMIVLHRGRKRQREKSAADSFDSGWTAWYYGHTLTESRSSKPNNRSS
jgi:hypothetical protein